MVYAQIHEEFSALFQMKITTFCIEMLSVLTTPFVLWYTLHARAPDIIDFFREFTVHVDGLGYVCSFGVFDFKRQDKAVPKVSVLVFRFDLRFSEASRTRTSRLAQRRARWTEACSALLNGIQHGSHGTTRLPSI